jgi:hypothetical protein
VQALRNQSRYNLQSVTETLWPQLRNPQCRRDASERKDLNTRCRRQTIRTIKTPQIWSCTLHAQTRWSACGAKLGVARLTSLADHSKASHPHGPVTKILKKLLPAAREPDTRPNTTYASECKEHVLQSRGPEVITALAALNFLNRYRGEKVPFGIELPTNRLIAMLQVSAVRQKT